MEDPLVVMKVSELERIVEQRMENVLQAHGFPKKSEVVIIQSARAAEVTTEIAKKILTEKGYRVEGHASFTNTLKEYNVTGTKRGKNLWFRTSEIDRIPAKK